jgi:hypothetical protein
VAFLDNANMIAEAWRSHRYEYSLKGLAHQKRPIDGYSISR